MRTLTLITLCLLATTAHAGPSNSTQNPTQARQDYLQTEQLESLRQQTEALKAMQQTQQAQLVALERIQQQQTQMIQLQQQAVGIMKLQYQTQQRTVQPQAPQTR